MVRLVGKSATVLSTLFCSLTEYYNKYLRAQCLYCDGMLYNSETWPLNKIEDKTILTAKQ